MFRTAGNEVIVSFVFFLLVFHWLLHAVDQGLELSLLRLTARERALSYILTILYQPLLALSQFLALFFRKYLTHLELNLQEALIVALHANCTF